MNDDGHTPTTKAAYEFIETIQRAACDLHRAASQSDNLKLRDELRGIAATAVILAEQARITADVASGDLFYGRLEAVAALAADDQKAAAKRDGGTK